MHDVHGLLYRCVGMETGQTKDSWRRIMEDAVTHLRCLIQLLACRRLLAHVSLCLILDLLRELVLLYMLAGL